MVWIMKTKPGLIIAFLLGLVFATACGQKGPLFLPGSPSTINSTVPAQQGAPVEESDEEEDEQTNNIN